MSTGAAPKETLPFTPDQKQTVADAAKVMQLVAGLLFLVGLIQIVGGPVAWIWLDAGFFSAVLTLALGVELFAPTKALQLLLDATPRHMGQVMRWLGSWLTTVKLYVVIFALLAIVAVVRLVLHAY